MTTLGSRFEITVQAEPRRVCLIGELDFSYARMVTAAIVESEACIIDCQELTYLDSAGFRALLDAHRQVEQYGRHVIFIRLTGVPLNVMTHRDTGMELHIAS
jgi:anti-anti-sigma factor